MGKRHGASVTVNASDCTQPLLHQPDESSPFQRCPDRKETGHNIAKRRALVVLPLALTASLAMAATAATAIFAYATLICNDPARCSDTETNRYAGSVAAATSIANTCSLLVLGPSERASRQNRPMGLLFWFLCRSMSVAMLALGVWTRSIGTALSGKVFEGLASDNLLHFMLNAMYVQTGDTVLTSRLIGTSLALFMAGISISPFLAGHFQSFTTSFAMALIIFAASIVYLTTFLCTSGARPQSNHKMDQDDSSSSTDDARDEEEHNSSSVFCLVWLGRAARSIIYPLEFLRGRPRLALSAVSLALYNCVQSYSFPAMMVYASLRFHFTSRENGTMLSLAHLMATAYLLGTLYVVPWIRNIARRNETSPGQDVRAEEDARWQLGDSLMAVLSLTMQAVAMCCIAAASQPWHLYLAAVFVALGLAAPSFIKAGVLQGIPLAEREAAVAALSMMETIGSLASPIALGGLQALLPGNAVFLLAAGFLVLALVMYLASMWLHKLTRP